jgi:lysozyme
MKRTRLIGAGGAITALGALTIGVVGQWEGLRLHAYQDVVGVWTACYGETKGIRPGMKFTQAQCDTMFIGSLAEHEAGMRKCLAAPDALPEKTYVSFVSVTYNIGVGGFCGSSMARHANAGDLVGACDALLRWNKAGGTVVKGLVNRRKAERELCLEGVMDAGMPPPVAWSAPPMAETPPGNARRDPESLPIGVFIGFGVVLAAVAGVILLRRRRTT